jgi:predicted metal-dependent hydrolase
MNRSRQHAREAPEAISQRTLPLFDTATRSPHCAPGCRVVLLGQQSIDYTLRRSVRRSIGFVIDDRGLTVTAPRWVTLDQIDQSLKEKSAWVLRKLVEWRDYASCRERLALRWEDGATLPYLGESLALRLVPSPEAGVILGEHELRVALGTVSGADAVKATVQTWLQAQARQLFARRIPHFATLQGRGPSTWALSSARTRWGSCGRDGAIRINWRLIHFPPHIVDYVIAHELAHLIELNHSRRFWAAVERLYPDWRAARDWLRTHRDDVGVD